MAKDQNRRFIWLLRTLLETGGITLEDLSNRWAKSSENDDHKELKRRTFYEHRDAVERMFDVNIVCKVVEGEYRYMVEDADQASRDNLTKWLIDSSTVSTALADCKDIKDKIILEPIAGGAEFMPVIVSAIRENKELEIEYKQFGVPEPGKYTVRPYGLKNFKHRWYLFAINVQKNEERQYGLERIISVKETDVTFKPSESVNPNLYYNNCIGVTVSKNDVPERIVLRVYKGMQSYLQTSPLHHSQTLIAKGDDYTDYQYYLIINNELRRELLSLENQVKVLEPATLVKQIREEAMNILRRYEEK